MFRIYSITSRSILLRSPTTLPSLRSFHSAQSRNASVTRDVRIADPTIGETETETETAPPVSTNSGASSQSRPTRRAGRPKGSKNIKTEAQRIEKLAEAALKKSTNSKIGTKSANSKKLGRPRIIKPVQSVLVEYLHNGFGGSNRKAPKGDPKRINVVSEKLCDDILERLKPSLTKHIGCDVIDINPGAGVWSSKLHDFLNPRTHVLMEPDDKLYDPLLQPLVDQKDSTYKLIPKSGVVWAHLEKVLSKEHLPLQKELEVGDRRLCEHGNDTLLVTANLGYFPRKPYRGFSSLPILLIYQFLSALRAHSLFHKYGHVRMLIWVAESEKSVVLPRTVAMRKKSAIEAEISCQNIFEVASSTVEANRVRRDLSLERQSAIGVLSRMEKLGIQTPEGRESIFSSAISTTGEVPNAGEVVELSRDFYKELDDLELAFAAGQFAEHLDGKKSVANQTPQYKRLKELRYRTVAENRKGDRARHLTSDYDAIMALQKEIFSQTNADTSVQRDELNARIQNWKDSIQTMSSNDQEEFLHHLDNHRTYHLNPPLLLWDRRDCDPLKVSKNEFYPEQEMSLLDFRPKTMWPVLREKFPANYDVFEYIVSSLLLMPTQSLRKGLTGLWPGAFEWLIAECPSLTDPNKGGNLDIDLITARSLTQEMYKEIIEAWMKWPFRPTRYELMARTGSGAYDPDDEPRELH